MNDDFEKLYENMTEQTKTFNASRDAMQSLLARGVEDVSDEEFEQCNADCEQAWLALLTTIRNMEGKAKLINEQLTALDDQSLNDQSATSEVPNFAETS